MIEIKDLEFVGHSLKRPECVLTHRSGLLFTADWTGSGGVSITDPASSEMPLRILSNQQDFVLRPNGIALENDGNLLATHLGENSGGVFRLHPDGGLEALVTEVEGVALPPTNYVHLDHNQRLWVTVSTRCCPRADAYRKDVADGFVVLANSDGSDARVVADGLGYTNECVMHPDGSRLFVNETFARRLICFDVNSSGDLVNRRTICEFGPGTFPDGIAFDVAGGIWITSIVSNRLIRVTENGQQQIVIEDVDSDYLAEVENAFQSGTMGRPHLDNIRSRQLGHVSSMAFGGPQLRQGYLGCLLGNQIATFRAPVQGVEPIHWKASLKKLQPFLGDTADG
jgi:sugar lactone lactonase YvrE